LKKSRAEHNKVLMPHEYAPMLIDSTIDTVGREICLYYPKWKRERINSYYYGTSSDSNPIFAPDLSYYKLQTH